MKILFFDLTKNSNYEGSDFGIKSHAVNVLPSISLTTSAMTITLQAILKAAELELMSIPGFSANRY